MSMHDEGLQNESLPKGSTLTTSSSSSSSSPARRKRVIAHEPSTASRDSITALENILRHDDASSAIEAWQERPAYGEYRDFSNRLRDELAPSGSLEEMLVDRIILSAWRMQTALRAEEIWTTHEATGQHLLIPERIRCQPLNDLRRDSKEAERGFRRAMKNLEIHRSMRSPVWGKAARTDPRQSPRDTFEPEPTPHVSSTSIDQPWNSTASNPDIKPAKSYEPEDVPSTPATPRWQDRLVYDFNISETSPVVKGTWVTVNHLVSLIVDGWTWADILRSHAELTEEDIRVCLAFATEAEGMEI